MWMRSVVYAAFCEPSTVVTMLMTIPIGIALHTLNVGLDRVSGGSYGIGAC